MAHGVSLRRTRVPQRFWVHAQTVSGFARRSGFVCAGAFGCLLGHLGRFPVQLLPRVMTLALRGVIMFALGRMIAPGSIPVVFLGPGRVAGFLLDLGRHGLLPVTLPTVRATLGCLKADALYSAATSSSGAANRLTDSFGTTCTKFGSSRPQLSRIDFAC